MAEAILICDPADPRVAAYTSVRERDLTNGHGGRFIIEGKIALEAQLKRGRFPLESVFVCETRLESLRELLRPVVEGVPIYTAPQSLMDQVAGFPIHRGVLACGLKATQDDVQTLIDKARARPKATLLIATDISNHDNTGALFRNAAGFGADAVLMDAQCCDPLYRKAIRVSSGASLWLPFSHAGGAGALVEQVKAAGFTVWTLTPRADAAPLSSLKVPDHLALVVGAEGPGLPDDVIAAGEPVRIPMRDDFDSVNVATAAAIALAHIFSTRT